MPKGNIKVRPEVGVAGCDAEGLVRVSEQFAELELEMVRRTEITAAQIAAEKADWAKVGAAMGRIYQTLCDEDNAGTMAALHEIETLLTKRGILVPLPVPRTREGAPSATPPISQSANQPISRQEEATDGE